MAIRLQESLRGVFYAPFYVALARDAHAAEGVEVRFVTSPRPGDAARNVMDGVVDVAGVVQCASCRRISRPQAATSSVSPR